MYYDEDILTDELLNKARAVAGRCANTCSEFLLSVRDGMRRDHKNAKNVPLAALVEDLASIISEELTATFPEHRLGIVDRITATTSATPDLFSGEGLSWLVHPLDGKAGFLDLKTVDYASCFYFMFDNKPLGAVVCAPEFATQPGVPGAVYEAWHHLPHALLNEQPIFVKSPKTPETERGIVFASIGAQVRDWERRFAAQFLSAETARNSVALALCHVACSKDFEKAPVVCISGKSTVSSILSGSYVLMKAGGIATHADGAPMTYPVSEVPKEEGEEATLELDMTTGHLYYRTVIGGSYRMNKLFVALAKAQDGAYRKAMDEMLALDTAEEREVTEREAVVAEGMDIVGPTLS
jgi:3'-phosphoadenosine 5'-phosphosulfate (PAPS) 3'-phosphatase